MFLFDFVNFPMASAIHPQAETQFLVGYRQISLLENWPGLEQFAIGQTYELTKC